MLNKEGEGEDKEVRDEDDDEDGLLGEEGCVLDVDVREEKEGCGECCEGEGGTCSVKT